VEVRPEGASAIYGGDAVAGVVNFILRDNFDGIESDLRYGTATQGGYDEYRAGLTAGTSWESGNGLLVYEYYKQSNLSAADRDFSKGAPLPNDLLPAQERHSVLASGTQRLTDDLKLAGTVTFSTRAAVQDFNNPAASEFHSEPSSNNLNASLDATWHLAGTWYGDFSGTYSKAHGETDTTGEVHGRRDIDSSLWTVDAKASGALLPLPGGEMHLAFGGQYRGEDFANTNLISGLTDRRAERTARALFAEVSTPLIGASNALPGIRRLELNVSGRLDDYDDFGSTTNEKVGLLWAPLATLKVRGSYSTSFNPPPLGRVGATDLSALIARTSYTNSVFGYAADPAIADVVAITVFGTGKDLRAETSRAYTAGLDFKDRWGRHDLAFSASWFDIKFEDRLSTVPVPVTNNPYDAPNQAYDNPSLFPVGTVNFAPTQSQISDLLATLNSVNQLADPRDAQIINLAGVVRNVSQTLVSGIDFDIDYGFDSSVGRFSLGANATWLHNFQQRSSATTPLVDKMNTLYNPIDLKMQGHAGYRHGALVANLSVNYQDDYRIDHSDTAARVASWTTFDVPLAYELTNTVLRLSAFNVLDKDPPFTLSDPGFGIYGFDPTNATPRNRFVAFELVKHF
jgi:outer membrane receptor protein involved in Fe transport